MIVPITKKLSSYCMPYFIVPKIPFEFMRKAKAYFEVSDKPYLEYSGEYHTIIDAQKFGSSFYLKIGDYEIDEDEIVPAGLTRREYAEDYWGYDIEDYKEDYGYTEEELDDEIDPDEVKDEFLENAWGGASRSSSPGGKAYFELVYLNLGEKKITLDDLGEEDLLGFLSFIDGEHPGSDYLGVSVSSALALSALQYRLNELNSKIKIQIVE